MVLHIGVCDDISLQRSMLIEFVRKYLDKREILFEIYEFSSGEELISNYPDKLDILFLDVIMHDMTGMDASRKIRKFDNRVEILFATSSSGYVHEGYEVRAYRYLMKPITYEVIETHLSECIDNIVRKNNNYIVINTKNNLTKIILDSVIYIETDKRDLIIHEEDKSYRVKMSMKNMEKILKDKGFFRCHTSFLVNLKMVESLNKNIAYIKGREIPISRYSISKFKIELINCLGAVVC